MPELVTIWAPDARAGGPLAWVAIRDIPEHCLCRWTFNRARWRYERTIPVRTCTWHISRKEVS